MSKYLDESGLSYLWTKIKAYISANTDKLPDVTSSDNGKVLTVVNGSWTKSDLPTYNGGVQ